MVHQLAILLLLLMNLVDVVWTRDILSVGGVEVNPISLWIIVTFGFSGLLLYKTAVVGVLFAFANQVSDCSRNIRIIFWGGISLYVALTAYHMFIKFFIM